MKTRLITAGVAIVVALTLIILGSFFSIVITAALSLVSVILCGEYLSAKRLNKELKLFIPSLVFALLIPLLSGIQYVGIIPLFVYIFGMCVLSVVFHKTLRTDQMMFAVFGVVLIAVSLSALNVLVLADTKHTAFWVVYCLGVPWIADSAAYFAGSYLGKHKLCPEISPNKTVEGAVGGILGGTLSALLIGGIFQLVYGEVTVYYGVLVLIGFVNSIVSIFGDLTFSVIKRSCRIKDFGSIMPGHGGLLDRFDSVIFCIPVVYIFSQFFYLCL
ncbi:MAG: phosphatidate cytidylyltransferase [Ruminococcus sp.]|nr:phosphatidate cytidylyltransferase [Ruminococcus sp.]